MRYLIGLCVALTVAYAAQSSKPKVARRGINTPGIQIPIAHLKPEAELPLAPLFIVFSDSIPSCSRARRVRWRSSTQKRTSSARLLRAPINCAAAQ